jgi:uncharacterized membrane protein
LHLVVHLILIHYQLSEVVVVVLLVVILQVTAAATAGPQILEQAAITVVGALVGMLATEGMARQTQPLTDLRVPAVAVVVVAAAMAVLAAAASASWVRALAVQAALLVLLVQEMVA